MSPKKTYLPLTDIDAILPIVNQISIFGGLSDGQLHHVFRLLKSVTYEKDEIIFRQGDSTSYIYIVISGKVKLYLQAEEVILELIELDVGHCFGESSLIGIQPHTANVLAVERVELVVLSGAALLELYTAHPEIYALIILNIARETCRRLHKADDALLHYIARK